MRSIESVETLMYDKVAHFLDIFFDWNAIQFYGDVNNLFKVQIIILKVQIVAENDMSTY